MSESVRRSVDHGRPRPNGSPRDGSPRGLATPLAFFANVAEQFLTAQVICCEPGTDTIGLLKNPTTSNCSRPLLSVTFTLSRRIPS